MKLALATLRDPGTPDQIENDEQCECYCLFETRTVHTVILKSYILCVERQEV